MRRPREDKAAYADTKKCQHPRCERELTEYGCRVVRLGLYCQQYGLWQYHEHMLRHPAPDPIGKAEQDVIDEFAPQVEELSKLADEATKRFDEAQKSHFKVLLELGQSALEPSSPGAPALVHNEDFDASIIPRRRLSPRAARNLQDREEELRRDVDEAEQQLRKSRDKLSAAENRYESRRRWAKRKDREVAAS
ncbi:hypothetical protein OOK40_31465 [Streptomyces sp. NBC_01481]|nr:hypothetical protein [Streptomyces sp. NBC_01481]